MTGLWDSENSGHFFCPHLVECCCFLTSLLCPVPAHCLINSFCPSFICCLSHPKASFLSFSHKMNSTHVHSSQVRLLQVHTLLHSLRLPCGIFCDVGLPLCLPCPVFLSLEKVCAGLCFQSHVSGFARGWQFLLTFALGSCF